MRLLISYTILPNEARLYEVVDAYNSVYNLEGKCMGFFHDHGAEFQLDLDNHLNEIACTALANLLQLPTAKIETLRLYVIPGLLMRV